MSKFKKVEESEAMPNYVAKRFANTNQPEDHFAHLADGAPSRRALIARESAGAQHEQQVTAQNEKSWETIRSAERYSQPSFQPADDTMSNLRPADALGSAIRRVMSPTERDTGPQLNPADFGLMERGDYEILARSASIWNPDCEAMTAQLMEKMEQEGHFKENSFIAREAKITSQRQQWESDRHEDVLRQRREVTARANPMLLNRAGQAAVRIGDERVVDGAFGIPDLQAVIAAEKERAARQLLVKEASDGIKRTNHKTREIKNDEWLANARASAQSRPVQDKDSAWMDSYMRQIGG